MEKQDRACLFLAGLTALLCLGELLLKTFWPALSLPRFGMTTLSALSLAALVGESWTGSLPSQRCWWLTAVTGALAFGLLPTCVRLVPPEGALPLALLGLGVFLTLTALFTSLSRRLATARVGRLGALGLGLGLFLALQGFAGLLG